MTRMTLVTLMALMKLMNLMNRSTAARLASSPRRLPRGRAAWVAGLVAGLPLLAQAHAGADLAAHHGSAFIAGFLHPFTGVDHLVAMLVVGVWSALTLRGMRRWAAPASFAAMLLVGAVLGLMGLSLPGVEPMIAVSLLALGLLLTTRPALPAWAASLLAGGFAVFHGLAHGAELGTATSPAAAGAGMLLATVVLHAGGLVIGALLAGRKAWLPRLAGAAVALFGIGLLLPLAA